jgi:hypothetical protein
MIELIKVEEIKILKFINLGHENNIFMIKITSGNIS